MGPRLPTIIVMLRQFWNVATYDFEHRIEQILADCGCEKLPMRQEFAVAQENIVVGNRCCQCVIWPWDHQISTSFNEVPASDQRTSQTNMYWYSLVLGYKSSVYHAMGL